jgi:hypothetical protein
MRIFNCVLWDVIYTFFGFLGSESYRKEELERGLPSSLADVDSSLILEGEDYDLKMKKINTAFSRWALWGGCENVTGQQ